MRAVLFDIDAFGCYAVEQPRAVEMHGDWLDAFRDWEVANELGDLFCVFEGEDCPAESVFEGDDAGWWEVDCSG